VDRFEVVVGDNLVIRVQVAVHFKVIARHTHSLEMGYFISDRVKFSVSFRE
jgi:hypothetical protein